MFNTVVLPYNPDSIQMKHLIYLSKLVITVTTNHNELLPILIFYSILKKIDDFKLEYKTNIICQTFVLISADLRLVHA